MGTTKSEISDWFDKGIAQSATHMIVVCDGFDHEDYPSYVSADQKVEERIKEDYGWPGEKNMQRVMEVYDLRMDKAAQLAERRAFHL